MQYGTWGIVPRKEEAKDEQRRREEVFAARPRAWATRMGKKRQQKA